MTEAKRQLEILSNTDRLTNLANRHYFNCMFLNEWNRGCRNRNPLSLIMSDVDYFKKFNDHYGHLTRDACFQTLSHSLSQVRQPSWRIDSHYGGDEFVILLPHTDKVAAFETAQQIKQIIISLAILHGKNNTGIIGISIGIASLLPSEQYSHEKLLLQADESALSGIPFCCSCIAIALSESNIIISPAI
nr:GGDEF domain-containing protein [uncultured Tolumonas sp.]